MLRPHQRFDPREPLVFDHPHYPAGDDGSADKEGEAECAEADHHSRFGTLGDAEDDRGEEREEKHGAEVRDRHESFLPVASEWASTAATTLSRPATTMNLVP
jgi:hypothetical protein